MLMNTSATLFMCHKIQAIELQWSAGRLSIATTSKPSIAESTISQFRSSVHITASAALKVSLLASISGCFSQVFNQGFFSQ